MIKKEASFLRLGTLVVPLLVGGGIVVALLREIYIAKYYGTSLDIEIFRLAYALPNFLSFTVATAFASAAVPIIIRAGNNPHKESIIYSLNIITIIAVFVIVSFGILTGKLQAHIFAPGFDDKAIEQLTSHIRITWFMFFFIGLSLVMRAALQARGVFWPGASNNIIKAGVYVFVFFLGSLFTSPKFNLNWLSGLAVLSGFIILSIHVITSKRYNIFVWKKTTIVSKDVFIKIGTALGATLIFQFLNVIPVFIDRAYASEIGQGVIASLEYSSSIIIAIGAILGTSFNMVVLPRAVELFERKAAKSEYISIIVFAGLIITITIAMSLLLSIYSQETLQALFMRGAFNKKSVITTSTIMHWQVLGMAFMVAATMAIQILIILNKFKLLVIIGILKVSLKILSLVILIPIYKVAGLGLSFLYVESIIFALLVLVILHILKRPNSNLKKYA